MPKKTTTKKQTVVKERKPPTRKTLEPTAGANGEVAGEVDGSVISFARGIGEYLYKERLRIPNHQGKAMDVDMVTNVITEYLIRLEAIPVVYSRNQLINDLIVLLKRGSTGVAPVIIDLLGFASVSDNFEVNLIDYKNLPENPMPDFRGSMLVDGKIQEDVASSRED